MKHLKMLGFAAMAALGLMAFVGAGTASATTLATNSAGTVKYAAGTTFHATLETGTSTTWTDTSGNTIATCTVSTVHGTIGTATGTWVGANIGTLTWENCSQTTDTVNTGSLEFMQTTGDEATVVGKGSNWTQQIFGVSCTYGFGEGTTLGTMTGGEAPTLKITATIPKTAGGFLCPSTSIIHAAYIFTSPHALHFVS